MKKSIFSKLGAGALVLTLVTASLVGGTFAKYTTEKDATASATVASWTLAFKNNDDSEIATFVLEGSGAEKKLVPGDSGQIAIKIKGDGSDVGYTYTIKVEDGTGALADLAFYSDAAHTTVIPAAGITEAVDYSATVGAMNKVATLYWKLADTATDEDVAGKTPAYTVKMNATQTTP